MPAWKKDRAVAMRRAPTPAEALLWSLLEARALGVRFRRQAPLYGYIADFWCPAWRLVVECDGPIHRRRRESDARRDDVLRSHGIRTIRFANAEVLTNPQAVVSAIASHRPKPSEAAASRGTRHRHSDDPSDGGQRTE